MVKVPSMVNIVNMVNMVNMVSMLNIPANEWDVRMAELRKNCWVVFAKMAKWLDDNLFFFFCFF